MKSFVLAVLLGGSNFVLADQYHCILNQKLQNGNVETVVETVPFEESRTNGALVMTAQTSKFKVTLEWKERTLKTTAVMPDGRGSSATVTFDRDISVSTADGTGFQVGPDIASVSCY